MSKKDSNPMPTDDDITLLRELFEDANTIDEVRNLLQASMGHYEPTREQRQANVLRDIVNDVFGDQTHLTQQQHPAAAHFDRIVNEMPDEEAKQINAAAVSTFGGPAFNPRPTPHVNPSIINSLVHESMDDRTIDELIHEEERKRKLEEQIQKGKEGGKKSKKTKRGKKARSSKKAKKAKK